MPGGTTTGRVRLFGIAAACCSVLALPAVSPASRSASIPGLQAQDAQLVAKTREAVLGLYSLDAHAAAAQARLDGLLVRERILQAQRASLGEQLHLAQLTADVSQGRLAARIRFLYDNGSPSALELIVGSHSIDEALTEIDNLQRVASLNDEILHEAQAATGRLHRLTASLKARTLSLAAAVHAAAATAAELGAARSARSAYIGGLVRRHALNLDEVARLEAQARAAAVRTRQLASPSSAPARHAAGIEPAASARGRTMTVVATGYTLPGRTATGLPVGWGVAAVDPSVIPLGTHLSVPGYGEAVAADTGGAVVGTSIDLWFPSVAQAARWGRRSITVVLN